MDDLDAALVSVRADTSGFARDVEAMRGELEGVLGAGAERAALRLEAGLLRAVRSGKLGFEELKGVALSALDAIASAALKAGVQSVLSGGGLSGALAGLVGGLPGRATVLVEVVEGCDKSLATCAGRFGNALNFRGEPYLPGIDLLTRYPGA